MPKEVFLVYSPQFIYLIIRLVPGNVVMVAIDICRKSRITGKWIYGITRKHVSAFMFFVYYLLVCLTIFLHFYICNVWFIVANNRILVLILEPFLFLNFITILLPGNTRKFCKQIFSFYWKWYIWKQSFKDSLWNGYFIYTWGIPVAGSISSRAAGLPLLWEWAPSWVFLNYFIYLLFELLIFGGNYPEWLLHNFKYTFYFNLHGKKALWRALLTGKFLKNLWYCISFLLNINSG